MGFIEPDQQYLDEAPHSFNHKVKIPGIFLNIFSGGFLI